MRSRVVSVSWFPVASSILISLLLAGSAGAQSRRFEKHFIVEGKPVVTVQNASGRIQVKSWDKQEVSIVGQRGSGRLIDQAQDLESGDASGILGGLALPVVEIRGNGDHGLRDRHAQRGLGIEFELAQHVCRNFRRRHHSIP